MSQELELPRPTRIYPSKRDPWVVVLLVLIQTAFIITALKFLQEVPRLQWIGIVSLGGSFLIGWILAGTYYTILEDRLQVRCGCFRWEIPLESIQRVALRRHSKRTALLGYGAALSMDAIRIRWERGGLRREILISPVEQDDFLADLLLIAPWIEVERDGD